MEQLSSVKIKLEPKELAINDEDNDCTEKVMIKTEHKDATEEYHEPMIQTDHLDVIKTEHSSGEDPLIEPSTSDRNKFKCNSCHRCFLKSSSLKKHMLVHICESCGKRIDYMKNHRQVYTNERSRKHRKCKQCLIRSSKFISSNECKKRFKCPICNRGFVLKGNLKAHLRLHRNRFKCDVCHKNWKTKFELEQHMTTKHLGVEPFQCEICEKCFWQKDLLKSHVFGHMRDRPYQCDVCRKSFPQSAHLMIHMLVHTGEKPFECGTCQRRFATRGNLKQHTSVHTDRKPIKCDVCEKCFKSDLSFKRHMRVIHAPAKVVEVFPDTQIGSEAEKRPPVLRTYSRLRIKPVQPKLETNFPNQFE